jgi:hypothetical protein
LSQPSTSLEREPALTASGFRFLRYWSINMWLAQSTGGSFPGFSYTEAETRRIKALAEAASRIAVIVWLAATVVIYIALAGVLMAGLFSLLSVIWPNPANVSEGGFFGAMIFAVAGMVALGLPLSIGLGGWVADLISGAPSPPEPADAALAAKVGRQFRRMGLFLAAFMGLAAAACAFLLDRH